MLVGPQDRFTYVGYGIFEAHTGANHIEVNATGSRTLTFDDGQSIKLYNTQEFFDSTFWGTLRHQCRGTLKYEDEKNNIFASVELGSVTNKPQDYCSGFIKYKGKTVSRIYGTYLGFIEFDGKRYWDIRDFEYFKAIKSDYILESDSRYRKDLQTLLEGKVDEAQKCKEEYEESQRADAKLRAIYTKKH